MAKHWVDGTGMRPNMAFDRQTARRLEMSNSPVSKARRAAGEFAIIVAGVLVALWLDAGWAWLQDRQDERALIADLRSDFEANRAALRQVLVAQDRSANVRVRF